MRKSIFAQKVGKVFVPTATPRKVNREPRRSASYGLTGINDTEYIDSSRTMVRKICATTLREGCYRIMVEPRLRSYSLSPVLYQGTLRIERPDGQYCISGDLYYPPRPRHLIRGITRDRSSSMRAVSTVMGVKKSDIPIYARVNYYGYLAMTQASLYSFVQPPEVCQFSLDFDFYEYEHPSDGFDGEFPDDASSHISLVLHRTVTDDRYEGTMYENENEVGPVTILWVSSRFRKAYLYVHTLEGATAPQAVPDQDDEGVEDFRTILATAGWDLRVSYKSPEVGIPEELDGVQSAYEEWSRANSHILLESLPDYDDAVLDRKWLLHLITIPGDSNCTQDCGLGRMFDNRGSPSDIGDVNFIAREGAITYSHSPYTNPLAHPHQNDLQHEIHRAFLRSAAHEVGHALNQIHQSREGGIDNSIMTRTGFVLHLLDDAGLDFPDDIALAFNETVAHHLIHQPDPYVRPGGMSFLGNQVDTPEVEDVDFIDSDHLELTIKPHNKRLQLGEPLHLKWAVKNLSDQSIMIPQEISDASFIARISITDSEGTIRFNRPLQIDAGVEIPLKSLPPGDKVDAETLLYWNKNGFVFENPGRYEIDVILLWDADGYYQGLQSSTAVWIDYPVNQEANEAARLLLERNVGIYVASGGTILSKRAEDRIDKMLMKYDSHPANAQLKVLRERKYRRIKDGKESTHDTKQRVKKN